jgi:hypothetical protein
LLRQTFFIYLSIRIFLRELHHHTSRRSDDLPGKKNVLQSERLYLLPVFCFPYEVHLEQKKQIVSQHHQLKDRFIGPKGLEQQVPNRHIILGFLDVILAVPAFFIAFNHFFSNGPFIHQKWGF